MLMADGGSNYCEKIDEDDEYEEFSSEDLYIEIDALLNMLDESSDELQSNQEDLSSSKNVLQGDSTFDVGSHESSRLHDSSQVLEPALPVRGELNCQFPSTCNAEASDSRPENVSALLDSSENSLVVLDSGNPEFSAQTSSPVPTSSTSLQDWSSQIPRNETSSPEDITVSQFEKHNGHTSSSFSEAGPIHISEGGENLYSIAKGETEAWTRHVSGDNDFKYYSHISLNDRVEVNLRNCGTLGESSIETLGPSENNSCPSAAISFRDPDLSMQNATSTESTICQSSEVLSNFDDHYSAMQYCLGSDDVVFPDPSEFYFPRGDYRSQVVASNGEMMNVMKDEVAELPSNNISSDGRMDWYIQQGTTDKSVSMMSMTDDYLDASRWKYNCEGDNYVSLINDSPLCHANDYHMDDKASMKLSMGTQPYFASKQEMGNMKIDRNDELNKSSSVRYHSIRVGRSFNSKLCIGNDRFLNNKLKPSYSAISPPISNQNHEFVQHEEEEMFSASGDYYSQDMGYAIDRKSCTDDGHLNFNVLDEHLCYTQPSTLNKRLLVVELDEQGGKMTHTNLSDNSHFEDEPDICIIENMSHPAPLNRTLVVANSVVASQSSQISDSKNLVGVGSMRHKAKDEQLILSAALQDLSQPKSEASPPDGALAVSLLRHQKIALSWMVQKETTSLHCCGGILADDQGLGKTISTIALILKERPPCFQPTQDVQHGELMTLNLDDDEDMHQVTSSSSTKSTNISVQSKGRPAAGTLVVCPTSVLRQWAEELHNKVTSTANLSVLVYHGSNRTKDPRELAKYDVVITTYSIVSMEVPKQSLGDEDDDERGKAEDRVGSTWELSSSKKRKFFSSSSKKYSKGKRKVDNTLLESVARPLAKVGWFRVVLDEAQSIKNHRTHVARACWGLRAKRRWCLSGTPIQNAIDDLYSYFRFLRYDPYASYKSFCSSIKVPINRNPSKGYKKLQAVLQTIMLRRTKGTLLDGQPIINLPSKVVELKKVEFTDEERDFYLKLEADSKAQFEEYAAAGTVKQNYVNILLMLLRLRQACDHPLLVRPYNSNSLWRSSAEVAKKLPWDKQIFLRNRLEASLAICGICNDVPEDAVVSECGHVFCKQCICEHLSGDDRQCPSRHCKVQLHISSIFSRSTLDCSLSEQSSLDGSPNCSGSEVVDPTEQFSEDRLYSSSKIKAALEVLQSLSKPRNDTSIDNSVQKDSEGIPSCAEKSSCIQPTEPVKATTECQNLIMDESSSNSDSGGGEKAIVFSQWTRMLDLLEACLKNTSIQYRRLDGTMSVAARDTAVKDFNTLPEVTVVIMSLKAASLGLNMVAACHVLLLDLWWNPTTEDQAIDRAHRIGQTRTVKVLRLTVKETIEDRILDLQRKKREMVSSAFGEDESGGRQTRLTVEDLKYLFMM